MVIKIYNSIKSKLFIESEKDNETKNNFSDVFSWNLCIKNFLCAE
jgi:hypothetical protein